MVDKGLLKFMISQFEVPILILESLDVSSVLISNDMLLLLLLDLGFIELSQILLILLPKFTHLIFVMLLPLLLAAKVLLQFLNSFLQFLFVFTLKMFDSTQIGNLLFLFLETELELFAFAFASFEFQAHPLNDLIFFTLQLE